MTAAERIYETYVKSLPEEERERLLELLKGDVESGGEDITASHPSSTLSKAIPVMSIRSARFSSRLHPVEWSGLPRL